MVLFLNFFFLHSSYNCHQVLQIQKKEEKKHEAILIEISNYVTLEGILGNSMLFPITKS